MHHVSKVTIVSRRWGQTQAHVRACMRADVAGRLNRPGSPHFHPNTKQIFPKNQPVWTEWRLLWSYSLRTGHNDRCRRAPLVGGCINTVHKPPRWSADTKYLGLCSQIKLLFSFFSPPQTEQREGKCAGWIWRGQRWGLRLASFACKSYLNSSLA